MTPLATSYSTTPFSLPPPNHYAITNLSSSTLYLFLSDGVLRRPVEVAPRKRTSAERIEMSVKGQ